MTKNKGNKDKIFIISQAFYGNKTGTVIDADFIDGFIIGWTDREYYEPKEEDFKNRTIVHIPEADDIVIIYNKQKEEEAKERAKCDRYYKALANIPEKGVELYSKCIVCKINKDGEFCSITPDDKPKFMKYLAD